MTLIPDCGNFELKYIQEQWPKYLKIKNKVLKYSSEAYLFQSPTSNCQMFSLAYAECIIGSSEEDIKLLFYKLYHRILAKKQFIIDVKQDKSDAILNTLKCIMKKKNSMKYVSSNGSKMVLHIIHMDIKKLG